MKIDYLRIELIGDAYTLKEEVIFFIKNYFEKSETLKIFGVGYDAVESIEEWQKKIINTYNKYKNRQILFERIIPNKYTVLLKNYKVLDDCLNVIRRLEMHRVRVCSELEDILETNHLDHHGSILAFISDERIFLGTTDRLKPKRKNLKGNIE